MKTVAVAAFVALLVWSASANVMGIDLGSEYIKVTCPHGNASIDIVLNEQTRRKSNNFVGFRGDDRFFGEDAKNLAARFPDNMFSMINKLVGISFNSSQLEEFRKLLNTFAVTNNTERNTVSVACRQDPECNYTAELVLAMYFQYLKSITAKDAKIKPQDAVITVPAFWSMHQRQSLVDSAALVDLRVLSVMHSTTATALQYGMQKRGFGNDTVNVIIYDMGATKTEVGVYRFSPPVHPKDGKKIKLAVSMGHLETLHIEVDSSLGGRTFDACIAQFLEDQIVAEMKIPRIIGGSSLQQHKASFSLLRAANAAKETLSANQITPVTVEGVSPDRDFSGKITRDEFESKCSDLFKRAVAVAERALANSGLTREDISSFELMGGGVRPPKVVADLSDFLGRPVDRTLNSDESAAFGTGYYGARLSGYFRVRSFSVRDFVPETIHFEIVGPDGQRSARRPLFVKSHFGSRKSITLNRTEDFTLALVSSKDGSLFTPLMEINVSGVRSALESLKYFDPTIVHENNTHIVRLELRLTENGLIALDESEVRVRYAANVTKKVKLPRKAISESEEEKNETSPSAPTEVDPPQFTHEIQMKRRSASIKPTILYSNPRPMDSEEVLASKSILSGLDKRDKIKRDTATSKNNLETYIQWIRMDGIFENSEAVQVMTEEERQHVEEVTNQVKEWYEDGEGSYDSCTKLEYDEQLAILKNATASIREKLEEKENSSKPKLSKKEPAKKRSATSEKKERPPVDPVAEADSPESPESTDPGSAEEL